MKRARKTRNSHWLDRETERKQACPYKFEDRCQPPSHKPGQRVTMVSMSYTRPTRWENKVVCTCRYSHTFIPSPSPPSPSRGRHSRAAPGRHAKTLAETAAGAVAVLLGASAAQGLVLNALAVRVLALPGMPSCVAAGRPQRRDAMVRQGRKACPTGPRRARVSASQSLGPCLAGFASFVI